MDAIDGAHAKLTKAATVKSMVVIRYFIHAPILFLKSPGVDLRRHLKLPCGSCLHHQRSTGFVSSVGFECNSGNLLSYFWTDRKQPAYFPGNLQILIQIPSHLLFLLALFLEQSKQGFFGAMEPDSSMRYEVVETPKILVDDLSALKPVDDFGTNIC